MFIKEILARSLPFFTFRVYGKFSKSRYASHKPMTNNKILYYFSLYCSKALRGPFLQQLGALADVSAFPRSYPSFRRRSPEDRKKGGKLKNNGERKFRDEHTSSALHLFVSTCNAVYFSLTSPLLALSV